MSHNFKIVIPELRCKGKRSGIVKFILLDFTKDQLKLAENLSRIFGKKHETDFPVTELHCVVCFHVRFIIFQESQNWSIFHGKQPKLGIIEGDQIEVAAFSLLHIWLRWSQPIITQAVMRSGAITVSIIICCDQPSQICKRLKRKSSYFNLVTFDNTLPNLIWLCDAQRNLRIFSGN